MLVSYSVVKPVANAITGIRFISDFQARELSATRAYHEGHVFDGMFVVERATKKLDSGSACSRNSWHGRHNTC